MAAPTRRDGESTNGHRRGPMWSSSVGASAASVPPASSSTPTSPSRVVDQHNYHTFQPLLYQVATDLLEPSAVGHPLRDLFHEQPNVTVHEAEVSGIDLGRARGAVRGHGPALPTTTSCWRSAPAWSSSASTAPKSTASRCTPSPTPCGSRTTCWSGGRRPTRTRHSWRTGRSTWSSSAAGPPASRAPAPSPSCTAATSPRTTRGSQRTRHGSSSSRPARPSCRCSSPTSAPTRSASWRSAASRCCWARWSPRSSRRASRSSRGPCSTRTRWCGARACTPTPSSSPSAWSSNTAIASRRNRT